MLESSPIQYLQLYTSTICIVVEVLTGSLVRSLIDHTQNFTLGMSPTNIMSPNMPSNLWGPT